jgi:hypothetical protein
MTAGLLRHLSEHQATDAHHSDVELDEFMTRSNTRARRGRRFARLILAEVISFVAISASR